MSTLFTHRPRPAGARPPPDFRKSSKIAKTRIATQNTTHADVQRVKQRWRENVTFSIDYRTSGKPYQKNEKTCPKTAVCGPVLDPSIRSMPFSSDLTRTCSPYVVMRALFACFLQNWGCAPGAGAGRSGAAREKSRHFDRVSKRVSYSGKDFPKHWFAGRGQMKPKNRPFFVARANRAGHT